jgi:hypothetical protein
MTCYLVKIRASGAANPEIKILTSTCLSVFPAYRLRLFFCRRECEASGEIARQYPLCAVMKGQCLQTRFQTPWLALRYEPGRIYQPLFCELLHRPAQFHDRSSQSMPLQMARVCACPPGRRSTLQKCSPYRARHDGHVLFALISIPHRPYMDLSSTSTRHHSP